MSFALRAVAILSLVLVPVAPAGAADPPQHWFSFHTKVLDAFDPGDSLDAAARPLQLSWRFDISGPPGWPATITTRTALSPSRLLWLPELAPAADGTETVYRRTGTTGESLFTGVRALDAESASLRMTIDRELVEGRALGPGGPVGRTLHIDVTPAETGRVVIVAVLFRSPAGPVSVGDVSCPGGRADSFGPGSFTWEIRPPVAGVTARFECAFRATNASGGPASYMPQVQTVFVQGPDPLFVPDGTRFAVTSDPLGTTELAVSPPIGAAVVGHLDQWEERRTILAGENRQTTTDREWLGAIFTDLAATTSHDHHQDRVQRLVPTWLMTLNALGTSWPASIVATTMHDPAQLSSAFPTTPVTVGGVTTYTWSGSAPVLTRFLTSTGIEVRRDLGFTARRELIGGRHVGTGVSQRTLLIRIRASVALPHASVNVASFTSAPVAVTTASCPGSTAHPFPQFGGLATWQLGPLAAGEEVVLTCALDLQNAASKAAYMPDVQISATRSIVVSDPAERTEIVIASETLVGAVTFRVTPGLEERALGRSQIVDRRALRMTGEDRILGHE